ncbi:MAG: hypothetical protein HYV01_26705 [Deltaproteobacteria bacterium]|nr:hypothetical protein [Deltaproteobacteria bacterium]MBI2368579.1 hypothetical protein [Deltaproteobacteria bacterium]
MMRQLSNDRGLSLVVVLMVMAILLSVIGAGLLSSSINTQMTANYQSGTKAFNAADTGINAGLLQLSLDQATSTAAFSGTLSGGLGYRSGRRTDSSPQPNQFNRVRTETGYSLGSGTGYNTAGYDFYEYQINVTGTYTTSWGTELAGREIEAQGAYGPVAR